jgi:hypothetical protein
MTLRGRHTTTTNKEGASDTSHNASRQAPSASIQSDLHLVYKERKNSHRNTSYVYANPSVHLHVY